MGTVNTLVITGYGTNSHLETAHAARLAGADRADVVHFSDIVAAKVRLSDYHFLVFPGGFLDGDDLGAAQAASMRWRYLKDSTGTPLLQSLTEFINDGKLILGICNGFQLLVKLGGLTGVRAFVCGRDAFRNDAFQISPAQLNQLPAGTHELTEENSQR